MSVRGDAGFTLVEMLVSVTLLAMLSLVLFNGLHFGRRVWAAAEMATAAADRVRAFQSELAGEVGRTYPEFNQTVDPSRSHIVFDGAKERLSFLAPDAGGSGALVAITLTTRAVSEGDPENLVVERRFELAHDGRARVIDPRLPAITFLAFSYFGALKADEKPSWHDNWSGQTKLPSLVRLQVAFADRRVTWPEFVVAPRIGADVSCTFDPMTKNCAGR